MQSNQLIKQGTITTHGEQGVGDTGNSSYEVMSHFITIIVQLKIFPFKNILEFAVKDEGKGLFMYICMYVYL